MVTSKSLFSVENKVVVITGGASGIGYAISKMFVELGAAVAILDMHPDVQAIAAKLSKESALGIHLDVTKVAALDKAIQEVLAKFKKIDVLVNNAGVGLMGPAEKISEKYWDDTMNVNLKAPFLLSQIVGRHMLANKKGSIINIASQASVIALPDHVAYCTSKAGISALTRSLALEWGPSNIRVNAVSPTVVLTDLGRANWDNPKGEAHKQQIPLHRFAEPEEIASVVVFLASDASAMITGTNLMVDGGFSIQ